MTFFCERRYFEKCISTYIIHTENVGKYHFICVEKKSFHRQLKKQRILHSYWVKTEYWKLEKLTKYTKTVTAIELRKYLHFAETLNFQLLYKKVAHTTSTYIFVYLWPKICIQYGFIKVQFKVWGLAEWVLSERMKRINAQVMFKIVTVFKKNSLPEKWTFCH